MTVVIRKVRVRFNYINSELFGAFEGFDHIDFAVFAGDEETDGERHAQHQHYADDVRRRADGGFEFVLRSHSAHRVFRRVSAPRRSHSGNVIVAGGDRRRIYMHDKFVAVLFEIRDFELVRDKHIVRFADDFTVDDNIGYGVDAVETERSAGKLAGESRIIPLMITLVPAKTVDIIRKVRIGSKSRAVKIVFETTRNCRFISFGSEKARDRLRIEITRPHLVIPFIGETPFVFRQRDIFHSRGFLFSFD